MPLFPPRAKHWRWRFGASIVVALSFAGLDLHTLIVTAIISIIVNGFNSSAVKYSSEHYLDELDGREKHALINYFVPSAIEFIFYFTISFLSILPLLMLNSIPLAVSLTVLSTLALLFGAGWLRGYMLRAHPMRDGFETALLGLLIICVGLVSGLMIH